MYKIKIIDIVTSPKVIRSDAKVFKKLIEEHNQLHMDICGVLKPKFHILLHYPTILLNNGPLINFWCMRFESKHRHLRKYGGYGASQSRERFDLLLTRVVAVVNLATLSIDKIVKML